MKILLIAELWKGSLGLSYYNAFKSIGCEIIQFDFLKEYQNITPFSKNRYVNILLMGLLHKKINKRLLKTIEQTKPEVIFVIKGSFLLPLVSGIACFCRVRWTLIGRKLLFINVHEIEVMKGSWPVSK